MRRLILLTAAPLALAACDSGKTVTAENASVAEVAEAAKGVTKFEAGKWENTVSFVDIDMAGMPDTPPQIAEMIKKQMAAQSNQTHSSCVTREMVDKPGAGMFTGRDDGQCRYEKFAMGGGKIDSVMVCKGAGGSGAGGLGDVRMAMAGSYTATTYDMTSDMKMAMPGAPGPMTIKTRVQGKRVGACDAAKS